MALQVNLRRVTVHVYSQSNPVEHTDVHNTYTKDGLYCVMLTDGYTVFKYPVQHIFQIIEVSPEGRPETIDGRK